MIRRLPLFAAFLALAACVDVTAPGASLDELPQGLDVQFAVSPGEVAPQGEFSAVLTMTNTTADSVRVRTTDGCLVVPNVRLDGVRYPFAGSGWICLAALTTHTFAPGEMVTKTWNMRAELPPLNPGEAHGAPAPRGVYRVQAEFRLYKDDRLVRATVERPLRVR